MTDMQIKYVPVDTSGMCVHERVKLTAAAPIMPSQPIGCIECEFDRRSAEKNALIKALRASLLEMTEDAIRYRWLRNSDNFVDGGLIVGAAEGEDVVWGEQLDRAIDTARSALSGKSGETL